MNKSEFISEKLLDNHLPLDLWGRDAPSKIETLHESYEQGEIDLVTTNDGKLVVHVTYVTILIRHGGKVLVRKTTRISDNTVYASPSSWSIRGIVHLDESPLVIAAQLISQVIFWGKKGIFEIRFNILEIPFKTPRISQLCPGLWLSDRTYSCTWNIPNAFYKPAGYTINPGKGLVHSYTWNPSEK